MRKLCDKRPRDWDRYLPVLLFAYRETKHASTGFSPFELLYGRTVRGPLAVVRQMWTDEAVDEEVRTTYQYVLDLRERLDEISEIAKENLRNAKHKQTVYFNKKAKDRSFKVGDKVLLLLTEQHNKLQVKWKGPYEILEKRSGQNYRINMDGKEKTFHINLLRPYIERDTLVNDRNFAVRVETQTDNTALIATVIREERETEDSSNVNIVPTCLLTEFELTADTVVKVP